MGNAAKKEEGEDLYAQPARGAASEFPHFSATFHVEGERLYCSETAESFEPQELTIVDVRRFEGKSNPDDMSVVYLIESRSGTRGTLTDAFGVYASPEVAQLIDKIPDSRPIF